MLVPKTSALPLGDAPIMFRRNFTEFGEGFQGDSFFKEMKVNEPSVHAVQTALLLLRPGALSFPSLLLVDAPSATLKNRSILRISRALDQYSPPRTFLAIETVNSFSLFTSSSDILPNSSSSLFFRIVHLRIVNDISMIYYILPLWKIKKCPASFRKLEICFKLLE